MNGESLDEVLQAAWWPALAAALAVTADLQVAEDAVQEACAAAAVRWRERLPDHPGAWLAATARHKALDAVRRETLRPVKELAATQRRAHGSPFSGEPVPPDPGEQLALLFLAAHPAFDPATRAALMLRAVCGLSTREIAEVLLQPEPTIAKRLVRARRKIRDSGMRFTAPDAAALAERLDGVLAVLSLLFTAAQRAATAQQPRPQAGRRALAVARHLSQLLPAEPEALGLTALLLLTDARAAARFDAGGDPVLLAEQDRTLYDRAQIEAGEQLLERALRLGRPGRWQLQAAIAACHAAAPTPDATDWREISALYGELLRHDPSPVHEANRAIAVAEAEGPAAGLVVLDAVLHHPRLRRWATMHVARGTLLRRVGRLDEARDAFARARDLDPAPAERRFIDRQLEALSHSSPT